MLGNEKNEVSKKLGATERRHLAWIVFSVWLAGYAVFALVAWVVYGGQPVVQSDGELNGAWAGMVWVGVSCLVCMFVDLLALVLAACAKFRVSKWVERMSVLGVVIFALSLLLLAIFMFLDMGGGGVVVGNRSVHDFYLVGALLVLCVPPLLYECVARPLRRRSKKRESKE
ncbi:MAG: hypothetical protein FWD76_04435 [Firmicutes bacterium]|nr:hypothetical protein [Bacillota bacterium]